MDFNENSSNHQQAPPDPTKSESGWLDYVLRYPYQIIGFFGWYVVNGLFIYSTLGSEGLSYGENWAILIITFPANLLTLILLTIIKPTRKLAFGILAAMAFNLVIASFVGVVESALCFYPFFSAQ